MIEIHTEAVANAASEGHANFEKPMSSIENAEFQAALADSILDAPIVGNHADPNWAIDSASNERHEEERYDYEVESEQEAEAQQADEQVNADEIGRRLADEYEHEQILNMAEASLNQPAQPIEWTPQQINDAIVQLDQRIQSENLIDHGASRQHLDDLCTPFGVNPNSIGGGFERAQGRMAVSAIEAYLGGTRSGNAPALSSVAIDLYSEDTLQAFGAQPREAPFEAKQALAELVRAGDLNLIFAFDHHPRGLEAPAFEINDPEQVRQLAAALNTDFATARHIANSRAEYMRGQLRSYLGANQRNDQQPQRGTARPSQRSRGGRAASRFRSNQDIFDNEAEELYRHSRGRL